MFLPVQRQMACQEEDTERKIYNGSGWYEEARDWAVDASLLDDTGMSVSPDEPCPRAAVVTFLYRIYR